MSEPTKPEAPPRIWIRQEILASAELREHFKRLNNDDIEYIPADTVARDQLRDELDVADNALDEQVKMIAELRKENERLTVVAREGSGRVAELEAANKAANKLAELSQSNEVRWMQKHSKAEAQVEVLHVAICQAVTLLNNGEESYKAQKL